MKQLSYYMRKKLGLTKKKKGKVALPKISKQEEKRLERKAAKRAEREAEIRSREIKKHFKGKTGPINVRVVLAFEEGITLYKWLKRRLRKIKPNRAKAVARDVLRQLKKDFLWERKRRRSS